MRTPVLPPPGWEGSSNPRAQVDGLIIGLLGNARVGKDTFAQRIADTHGFVRVGLADPLKRFCQDVFNFSDDQLWGDGRDRPDERYVQNVRRASNGYPTGVDYLTPRYALQTLGTEWGRHCYGDVWIEYGIRVARTLLDRDLNPGWRGESGERRVYDPKSGIRLLTAVERAAKPAGVVFSDLRFRNEFDAVKKAGGVLIRIYREGHDGKNLAGVAMHASEEEQRSIQDEEFHHIVHNPEGLPNYYQAIDRLMAKIAGKK